MSKKSILLFQSPHKKSEKERCMNADNCTGPCIVVRCPVAVFVWDFRLLRKEKRRWQAAVWREMGHVTGDATRMRVLGNVGFLSSSGTVQDSVRGETRYLVYSSCLVVVTSRLYKLVYIRVVLKTNRYVRSQSLHPCR